MPDYDRDEPTSGLSTAVGSVADDGHRMGRSRYNDDATEETGLLGAGAQDSDDGAGEPLARERTDSWVGWQDFQELPPWRRPSVRLNMDG